MAFLSLLDPPREISRFARFPSLNQLAALDTRHGSLGTKRPQEASAELSGGGMDAGA